MEIDGLPDEDEEASISDGPQSHPLSLGIEDYIFRGDELHDYSIYELACITCAKGTTAGERARYVEVTQKSPERDRPRNWNRRVLFQPEHSKADSRWTSFLRHPKVPCIVGREPHYYLQAADVV